MEMVQIPAGSLEKVKTYDFGQSREVLTELSDAIRKQHGNAAELKKIEKTLIEVLESKATYAGKQYVCRELSIIGTGESVPALAKMLTDTDLSDMARYALERMPGEAVDKVLLEALPKASGKAKIGIVNTLGERRCIKAVSALKDFVNDSSDESMVGAAISALGKIGGTDAADILRKARDKVPAKLKTLVCDACLKCAEQFAAKGQRDQAMAIYKELSKEGAPPLVRTAAMRGMSKVGAAGEK
jgi:hypothetical protein